MLEIKKNLEARKTISRVFQDVNDMVVPTMGAKGLLVALDDDLGKCTLTDDGVTVARQAIHMDGIDKMIAVDMIEAAATTEREALDGTTLTILLTNALYQYGYKRIRKGEHPQVVADRIEKEIKIIREYLDKEKMNMTDRYVEDIATISTKLPVVGKIIKEAYKNAGKDMNIIIEHDRDRSGVAVEHSEGFGIDSGYMSDAMRSLCEDGDKWVKDNCWVVLMKEGIMTQAGLGNFFKSIPEDKVHDPFVFIMNPNFNPNTLRLLIDTLIKNNMTYQFIFINEDKADDVYMDIAAVTGGQVQDASNGIGDYLFEYCGKAKRISIEIDKSLFVNEPNSQVKERIKIYKNKLKKKFKVSRTEEVLYTKRLGALENGIVKIKVGVPTVTEYQTLRLKLDDAIGAVRKAFESGIVLGGGKTLYNIANAHPDLELADILKKPLRQVCVNGGIKNMPPESKLKIRNAGVNVMTGRLVDLLSAGILDSFTSIDEALKNSSSIACSYLRCNCLIKKGITQNK